jgi:hypothetical protein
MALDHGNAIVAVSGWAAHLLEHLIFDTRGGKMEWAIQLEETFDPPILLHYNRLDAIGLTPSNNITVIQLDAEPIYYHKSNVPKDKMLQRRQLILSAFFQKYISKQNLDGYHALQQHLAHQLCNSTSNCQQQEQEQEQQQQQHIRYTVIHSRWLEGECEFRVRREMGQDYPVDECHMYPSYVKKLLGTPIDQPIVLITDGQNKRSLTDLESDPDIGPNLIVQNQLMAIPTTEKEKQRLEGPTHDDLYYVLNDLMVAVLSDTFIGTRVSTFALNVGRIRVLSFEADPQSNYIHVRMENGTNKIEICEDCIFF